MDFLHSCSTTLHTVEGYSSIEYQIYVHADAQDAQKSGWDDADQRNSVLLGLRQRRVLVQSAVMQKKVCVFGGFGPADDYMKELGWQVHQRGRLEAAAWARPPTDPKLLVQNQHIFSMFLGAIEASLSMSLHASCAAVRVGHLTWIVPTDADYQLLSLRAQLTAHGTLALLPYASNTGLSPATEKEGSSVILAPSGTPATVASSQPSLAFNDDAPPQQARREARLRLSRRAKDDSWKSSATPKLQHASLPHDSSWMRVSLHSDKSPDNVSCLWPESLCLEIPARQRAVSIDQLDSMDWFDSKNPYQDPIKAAESWFLGQAERTDSEQKSRQAEKDKEVAAATNPPEEAVPDQLSVASPVYSRSVQDQISVNGIYPTPPDGVLPTVCAEPPATNIMAIDTQDMAIEELPGIPEDDQEPRRHSNISDLGVDANHFRKGSSDDLFEDGDEEMFGNPDVTDADFSFFDNPGAAHKMPSIAAPPENMADILLPDPTLISEPVVTEASPVVSHPEPQPTQELVKIPEEEPKHAQTEHLDEPEIVSTPPLSPLKIKERLLPEDENSSTIDSSRRDSTFLPVVFKNDINNFDAKYRPHGKFNGGANSAVSTALRSSSIALPEKRPKARIPASLSRRRATVAGMRFTPQLDNDHFNTASPQDSDLETSQDSDSDSVSSIGTSFRSLDIRKRKRTSADEGSQLRVPAESVVESDVESVLSEGSVMADPGPVLDQLIVPRESQNRLTEQQHKFADNSAMWRTPLKALPSNHNLNIWPVLDFTSDDLVDIAQLAAEQSTFPESPVLQSHDSPDVCSPVYFAVQDALKQVFDSAQDCDFAKVGVMASQHAEQAIAAAAKNQQRPAPRRPGPINSVINIPPPSVHVHRSGQAWELQPTALSFWETMGLEPAGGPKDVISFALYPDSGVVGEAVADFLQDIRLTYENCKFGDHQIGSDLVEKQDGLMPYRPQGEASTVNVLQGIQSACNALGDMLHEADLEEDKPIIIYIVDPFQEECMTKYLCGCFQALYISVTSDRDISPQLILQIIPISRIASPTSLIVPDLVWLHSLAAFLYDRIPSLGLDDHKSVWQLDSAPAIHLASAPTRKINFALTQQMPRNLLEEAQILHVGYAVNADNSWLSAAWTDNRGRYQHRASYCLGNVDGKTVLSEVRDTTLSLARSSTWRIFVARAGVMRDWEKRVWREHPAENWSIALLDIDVCPALQVGAGNDAMAQAAFLTPAATPQGSTFTSPETAGAPSTPAETPQDTQQAPDPDAFLIDTTDETWGMLMPFSCTRSSTLSRPLASGLLLKRGDVDSAVNLPSLGVDLIDVMLPRTQEGTQGWLAQRAPETVLKECLVWYRGLALLARLRGIPGAHSSNRPWHIAVAMCGADALQGFLE